MRLFCFEWKKVLRDPFVVISIAFLLLCSILSLTVTPIDLESMTPEGIQNRNELQLQINSGIDDTKKEAVVNSREEYTAILNRVLSSADANLISLDETDDDESAYLKHNFEQNKEIYTNNLDLSLATEREVNANTPNLFHPQFYMILLLLAVIILCTKIFLAEYEDDAVAVVRTTALGRARILWTKYAVAATAILSLELLFTAAFYICFVLQNGAPSLHVMIQSFPLFTLCPWAITVGQAFLFVLALRLGLLLLFGALIGLFCYLFRNVVGVYLFGVLCIGSEFYFSELETFHATSYPVYLNLFTLTQGEDVLTRFRGMQVFRFSLPLPTLAVMLTVLFLFIFFFLSLKCYHWNGFHWVHRMHNALKAKKQKRYRMHRATVLGCEWKRFVLQNGTLLFLAILLFGKTVYDTRYREEASTIDYLYHYQMTEIGGEVTSGTEAQLQRLNLEIASVNKSYDEAVSQYQQNQLDEESYRFIRGAYLAQSDRKTVLKRLEKRLTDVKSVITAGNNAQMVFENGWEKLFTMPFDIFFYLFLLLLCVRSFSYDYETGTAVLIRTAKGQGYVARRRMLCIAGIALVASIMTFALDGYWIMHYNDCPLPNAPLCSLPQFYHIRSAISIKGALALMLVVRCVCAMLFTALVCYISAKMKRTVWSMAIGILILVSLFSLFRFLSISPLSFILTVI